jgi:hypothetical protein
VTMITSGVLALGGLSGVIAGNMQLRNIGIVGYVGVFLVVAVLLAILFYRATPQGPDAAATTLDDLLTNRPQGPGFGPEQTCNPTANHRLAHQWSLGAAVKRSPSAVLPDTYEIRTYASTPARNRWLVGGAGFEPAASCMSSISA